MNEIWEKITVNKKYKHIITLKYNCVIFLLSSVFTKLYLHEHYFRFQILVLIFLINNFSLRIRGNLHIKHTEIYKIQ